MHPVVRIVCFLIFSLALARPGQAQLLLAAALLGGLFVWRNFAGLSQALFMLRRLRWLLVSILIVYGWFTPGTPIAVDLPAAYLPTLEGLQAGLWRVLTLGLILLAAGLLLAVTSRAHLVGGLYWLMYPARHLRFKPERLAVRLALTLEYVEHMGRLWAQSKPAAAQPGSRLQQLVQRFGQVFEDLIKQAEQTPPATITLELAAAPARSQWLLPVLLLALFVLAAWI